MGALVALIAPKLLPALIPAPIRNALAWAAVIAFVVLTAGIGLKVYNGRLRREGRDQEPPFVSPMSLQPAPVSDVPGSLARM